MAPQNTRAPSAASPALLSHPQICGVVYHLLSAGSGYLCCENAVLPNAPRHEPALFFMPLNGPGPKPSDKRTVPGPIDEVPSLSLRNSRATAFIHWSTFLCSFRAVSSNQLTIYNKRDSQTLRMVIKVQWMVTNLRCHARGEILPYLSNYCQRLLVCR